MLCVFVFFYISVIIKNVIYLIKNSFEGILIFLGRSGEYIFLGIIRIVEDILKIFIVGFFII